jgi:carbamoyltransferase
MPNKKTKPKYIIGIHGDNISWTHDPSVGVVNLDDDTLILLQAERQTRQKYGGKSLLFGDFSTPQQHFQSYLASLDIEIDEIESFAFVMNANPYGFDLKSYPEFLQEFLGIATPEEFHGCMNDLLLFKTPCCSVGLLGKPTYLIKHHTAHCGYTFFTSPYQESFIFSYDGGGFNTMTQICWGKENKLFDFSILPNHWFGFLYKNITDKILEYLSGQKADYGSEGKVMALSAYEKPVFLDAIKGFLKNDYITGGYDLSQESIKIYTDILLFDAHAYTYEGKKRFEFASKYAASWQAFFETSVLALIGYFKVTKRFKKLCIAGGCGLNGLVNLKLKEIYENVWISPATSDTGVALGAALYVKHSICGKKRIDYGNVAYKGQSYDITEEAFREFGNLLFKKYDYNDIYRLIANKIAEGKIIAWYQDRSESGPRALGNRSILCDPRNAKMKDILNARIKHREMFRPFAPAILEEKVHDYFDREIRDPYMLTIAKVNDKARKDFPAAIHIDGTARLQTLCKKDNEKFYNLINEFYQITNVPVLLNTSFNDSGEPIVETVNDALKAFVKMDIDILVAGNYVIYKPAT